jgi:lysophospholipase L1-like esterase
MSRPVAWSVATLLTLLVAAPTAAAQKRDLYVALGDSYTTGYQPTGKGKGSNTRNGFTFQLASLARQRGYKGLKHVNFGCGGETTVSLLGRRTRCKGPAPGGVDYTGKTQMAASEAYLRKNRRRVAFVTVLIGGNDVTACAKDANPVPCVVAAADKVKKNVATIARRVRRAVGPKVPVVAGTYPDVILGQWVTGRKEDQDLASLSTVAFKSILNPALKAAYEKQGFTFVDVTAATGAYGPLDQFTTIEPYGSVPVPVATICEISFYCVYQDIHLRTNGYRQMAELFVRELPRPTRRR